MKCNDTNFIKRLKRQKEDSLEYVIDQYSSLVHAICYKVLSNISNEAVEECVNDVFLTVWQNANQFKGEAEDFKKWIAMITKYKAIDRFRQLERLQAREQSDEFLTEHPAQEDVQMHVLKKEERNTLLLALSTLPDIDRDIFMMKYSLYLSTAEISEALNLSISAVENRLYRGKKKLAQSKQLKERFL
ncbi:sigma-70 family RNA polymerase sigma factor [Ornithinibacillus scapharcae]|uniref:sigma-70 family RNA polymerase sigma factor n=1 Tax=Ornithinibacillus scapharcae TaxID=1147159 RepID=UPI000225BA56|nr:sigma-70 family RNA polymerase sigma factor [Ornithinibacillus scapharcae]